MPVAKPPLPAETLTSVAADEAALIKRTVQLFFGDNSVP